MNRVLLLLVLDLAAPLQRPLVLSFGALLLLGGSACAHNSWLGWLGCPSKHQQRREDLMDEGLSTSLWMNWFLIQLFGCWLLVLLGSGAPN